MGETSPVAEGVVLTGSLFDEPMRVETVRPNGPGLWRLGLVGTRSERFRGVTLSAADISGLEILDSIARYDGDGNLLRLGLQAYALGIAWEFDPYFGLSVSRVDPLPHQLSAVYDHMLRLGRVRFLLADDAGAGKTIMAGLLLRELKLRGLVERTLVVCPANLAFQWQRELQEKFHERFLVLKGGDIREQFGVNQWMEQDQIITSLDLAKRDEILPGLRQVHWDLVIVDEAHRMSWTPPARKTARYALGELLRDATDHFVLLTATPHKGDPENFTRFLQLLDEDAYADVRSIHEAMQQRQAPFYLRRTKEAMVYFPERQADGTWAARKIFTKRIPHSVAFQMDGAEFELYRAATSYVKRQSIRAAAEDDDPRSRAVGFLMALYQRRLASSTYALRRSLENRARRLEENLKNARELSKQAPTDLPDPEELEEMEESERERFESIIEAVTLADNAAQVHEEVKALRELAAQAQTVEQFGTEAKLVKLKDLLGSEGFYEDPDKRLLIFTEFRDTLDYLVEKLSSWGFRVGAIHGGMKPGDRDVPGSRVYSEQMFKEGTIQILVATEAAGEGINLQFCHIMFNYDIPWNPNRLEQRMGRIHRYGQIHDCLIFNFVATNTIEGQVLRRLLEKLQEIRDALDEDSVFNVVGEILPAAHVERVLRDYYAGKLGDADLEDRLLRNVDEGQFRAICHNALEGLATKNLNLDVLVERRARAQERRVVPEDIARFIAQSAPYANLDVKPVSSMQHAFDVGRTSSVLRRYEREPDWKLPAVATRYHRCSTDRQIADLNRLEWVTPAHPLFEALRRHTLETSRDVLRCGACFYSLQHDEPARIDFYRARAVDGLGDIVHERMFVVELTAGRGPRLRDAAVLGNYIPAEHPGELPPVALEPEVQDWLTEHALGPFMDEVRAERLHEVEHVADHIELALTELLGKADEEVGKASEEVTRNAPGAEGRLAMAENRHQELWDRRERRRQGLARQRALTLQSVERIATALVLPHPERDSPEVQKLRPNLETEAIAMRVVMEYELSQGREPADVHEKDLGYDIRSIDSRSGELRLVEVKGLRAATGTILLSPNERRVAEDRPDCYWLYIVTGCAETPQLQEPVHDPARFPWHEVTKVRHYWLDVNAMTQPMMVREEGNGQYEASQ